MHLSIWKKRPVASISPANGDLTRLREEMDRAFDRFLADPFALGIIEPKGLRSDGWVPAIDVSENGSEVTIHVEAPGVAAKDFDISVSGSTLTIAGQKEESSEMRDESYFHCERRFGAFRRSIDLPETADTDKVTAESDNGVVTIHVAKRPGAKPKQVEVKPAARKVVVAGEPKRT